MSCLSAASMLQLRGVQSLKVLAWRPGGTWSSTRVRRAGLGLPGFGSGPPQSTPSSERDRNGGTGAASPASCLSQKIIPRRDYFCGQIPTSALPLGATSAKPLLEGVRGSRPRNQGWYRREAPERRLWVEPPVLDQGRIDSARPPDGGPREVFRGAGGNWYGRGRHAA
jgi:hypothetical protein